MSMHSKRKKKARDEKLWKDHDQFVYKSFENSKKICYLHSKMRFQKTWTINISDAHEHSIKWPQTPKLLQVGLDFVAVDGLVLVGRGPLLLFGRILRDVQVSDGSTDGIVDEGFGLEKGIALLARVCRRFVLIGRRRVFWDRQHFDLLLRLLKHFGCRRRCRALVLLVSGCKVVIYVT